MKKQFIYIVLGFFLLSTLPACKAKHCAALDDTMEGYDKKRNKRKKGRQEGLFPKGNRGY
ncbi:MAG: hypothetical protein KJP21_06295 [Bacteroidia bacterium]|nr:hypothetical protein [Bacteroidia bacterium]NNJ56117.1 hypothetical protein [Bacteroidia bacterium]